MKVLAVIPARFASTRFPGKPLALIAGKPMIRHVWECCRQAEKIDRVIVATDDRRIVEACAEFGGEAEITSSAHQSGTDRVAEVAARHPEFDAIINVQGDEPGIQPQTISAVAAALSDLTHEITTAISTVVNLDDLTNPHIVKVVTGLDGRALYFSRAGIPFHRDGNASSARPDYFRHQGIYGFQRDILQRLTALPVSPLEFAESLEQLRWLQSGYRIHCVPVKGSSVGIDTPEDLLVFEKTRQQQNE